MPSLLSTAETASQVGVSSSTVIRAARIGELPYVRKMPGVRGAYLFDPGVVALWARQNGRALKRAS